MAKEIERKFLVNTDMLRQYRADSSHSMIQAYLSTDPDTTVRIRVIDGNQAFITIKGRNSGIVRDEWEYPIPAGDAMDMLHRLPVSDAVEKTRLRFGRWEVDIFGGKLLGLAVAEIELSSADEQVSIPAWAGREVTGDVRYYNSSLVSASELPPTV